MILNTSRTKKKKRTVNIIKTFGSIYNVLIKIEFLEMKKFLIGNIDFGIVYTKNVLLTKIKLFLIHVTKYLQYLYKTIFVLLTKP